MAESDTFGGCTVAGRTDEGDGAVAGRETIGNGMWLDFGVSETSRSVVERFQARSQAGLALDASSESEGSNA